MLVVWWFGSFDWVILNNRSRKFHLVYWLRVKAVLSRLYTTLWIYKSCFYLLFSLLSKMIFFQESQVTLNTIEEYVGCLENGKGPYMCGLCHVQMKERYNVLKYIRAVHLNIRNHRCSFCDAAFTKKAHCTRHEQTCREKPDRDKLIR